MAEPSVNKNEQDDEYLHVAANALKAVQSGEATTIGPYRVALYGRLAVEKYFEILARIYTIAPSTAIFLFGAIIVIFGSFCAGFVRADINSSTSELFITSEIKDNVDYTDLYVGGESRTLETVLQFRPEGNLSQTNFTNSLLDHVELVRSIIDFPILYNGR